MAYEKQTWNTGDVITAEKLNHMEDGLENAGGALIVHNRDNTLILDKTFGEIWNAYVNGVRVLLCVESEDEGVTEIAYYHIGLIGYYYYSTPNVYTGHVSFNQYADYDSSGATLEEMFNSYPANG